jgi:hypothetical protein
VLCAFGLLLLLLLPPVLQLVSYVCSWLAVRASKACCKFSYPRWVQCLELLWHCYSMACILGTFILHCLLSECCVVQLTRTAPAGVGCWTIYSLQGFALQCSAGSGIVYLGWPFKSGSDCCGEGMPEHTCMPHSTQLSQAVSVSVRGAFRHWAHAVVPHTSMTYMYTT